MLLLILLPLLMLLRCYADAATPFVRMFCYDFIMLMLPADMPLPFDRTAACRFAVAIRFR